MFRNFLRKDIRCKKQGCSLKVLQKLKQLHLVDVAKKKEVLLHKILRNLPPLKFKLYNKLQQKKNTKTTTTTKTIGGDGSGKTTKNTTYTKATEGEAGAKPEAKTEEKVETKTEIKPETKIET